MGKEKKEKKKKSKVKGGFLGRLRRSSAEEAQEKEQLTVATPENDGQKGVAPRKKSKAKRGLFRGSMVDDGKKGKAKGGKGSKEKENKSKVLPGQTSYSQNKPKVKKSKKKKKPRKKAEVVIKRGNQKRDPNKHFPGTVSYKYTSPEEVWVKFLGRTPEVNDYGNGARLMLDETDN